MALQTEGSFFSMSALISGITAVETGQWITVSNSRTVLLIHQSAVWFVLENSFKVFQEWKDRTLMGLCIKMYEIKNKLEECMK